MLPEISNYGEYASSNYGAHCLRVDVGGLTIWFSYKTPVAFHGTMGRVVRQNDWKQTTGKHLNWIDGGDKKNRVTGEKFEELFNQELKQIGMVA